MDISTLSDEQIMTMQEPPADATSTMESPNDPDEDDKGEPTKQTEKEQTQEEDKPDEKDESQQAEGDAEDESDENTEDDENKDKTAEKEESSDSDPKAILDKIFAPFIANGKEIKIDNADDAIRLMQMGAGFNKKMATLKPHLKIVKILEQHGLLDEGKLNHLIDVSKKDPAAISKLLADSGVDPLNLTSGKDYKPTTYTVDDVELELDDVLGDLKESPHYKQTLEVVVDRWDEPSKKLLLGNPQTIRVIHDHISSGIYDQVISVMERERALGKLKGLNDIQAYKVVGDAMDEQGLFGKTTKQSNSAPAQAPAPKVDESLKSRKLAASPTKSSAGKKDYGNFDPLKATDAEIMAMSIDKFL